MIEKFNRDSAYFQSLRDRNMTISYTDLDFSFNQVADYLNNKILPIVDQLAGNRVVGVQDHPDYLVRNIGDGSTVFDHIKASDIPHSSLTLDKFEQRNAFSLVASDLSGRLQDLQSTDSDQVVTSNSGMIPAWKKLGARNFTDASITSEKVVQATLSARHLADDILEKPLSEGVIKTDYIRENTIPNSKIKDGSFTNTKISAALMATRVAGTSLEFQDDCFSERTIADNSLNIMESFFITASSGVKSTPLVGFLTNANIPINAIELKPVKNDQGDVKFNVYEQFDSSIIPSKIKAESLDLPILRRRFIQGGLSLISQGLVLGKNNLSPELKTILINKGGLKP